MRNLILLRGVSGAGKSTVAKLMKAVELFSTDDYFMVKGKYEFDPSKLEENHKKCLQDVENVMIHKKLYTNIVVHNTFTQEWEMQPYFDIAKEHGYTVHTLIVENRHRSESIHNVPDNVVNNQRNRFQVSL